MLTYFVEGLDMVVFFSARAESKYIVLLKLVKVLMHENEWQRRRKFRYHMQFLS